MALNEKEANELLTNARKNIGKTYADMDCSHFVWQAYKDSGKEYPYRNTAMFDDLVTMGFFEKFDASYAPAEGDIVMLPKHMGIWDSKGCSIMMTNSECKNLGNDAPFLSSRSGKNRGPDYGRTEWWKGGVKAIYRWKKS